MFIGREKELTQLGAFLIKKTASLIVVKGRRRIGKSRMLEEFAKQYNCYKFSGLPPEDKVTNKDYQRKEFVRLMAEQGITGVSHEDWGNIFWQLAQHTKSGRAIIILDEVSWMASLDPDFLGKLKNSWDLHFKNNPKLILILCGSVSYWIDKNILSSTGYLGRISLTLTLQELSLSECNKFLDTLKFSGSVYEKFKILSVTGGIPWYLEQIRADCNADENIRLQCFTPEGMLVNEFNNIFHDLFNKKNKIYRAIVETLAAGPLEFKDICNKLGLKKSGSISDYLKILVAVGFIHKDFTWHFRSGKESALSHYRLSDNYLRFYLKYIEPNWSKIQQGQFAETINNLPGWSSVIGLQFENLVLRNRLLIQKILNIKPEDIIANNPYFQTKTARHPGCQIDYLIQTKYNTLFACEIKFSKNEINSTIIQEMQDKLSRLTLPKAFSCFPVLIHVNGVTESVGDSAYFTKIINFSELLTRGKS
ncbi:MAG: AAA family ATPase [Gammaproteobacteria bacterium]|nr:AAA family ATPase [Gammaproteobacteria bacterium]